jgi:hypothetical protein
LQAPDAILGWGAVFNDEKTQGYAGLANAVQGWLLQMVWGAVEMEALRDGSYDRVGDLSGALSVGWFLLCGDRMSKPLFLLRFLL